MTRLALAAAVAAVGVVGLAAAAAGIRPGGSEHSSLGAHAETPLLFDVPPVTPPLTSRQDALEADARTIAEQTGRDIETVRLQLVQQLEFDGLVDEVAGAYPETFAGSWTEIDTTTPESFIRFKGSVPSAAADRVASGDANVTLLDAARYSLAEMYSRARMLHADLSALGATEVSTAVDAEMQEIFATATWPEGTEGSGQEALLDRLPESARASDISIVFINGPLSQPAHTYGGAWMLDDGAAECTSGFTATQAGTTGVTTAAHCNGINQYRQPDTDPVIQYSAPWVNEHYGQWGDVEFHTTTHPEYARFYADVDDFRSVNGVQTAASIDAGDAICGFGRKSNEKHCGYVKYAGVTCGSLGSLVYTTAAGHLKGDSGGPIFLGTIAYGGFMGWCTHADGVSYDAFSVAHYFPYAIGVSVLTE